VQQHNPAIIVDGFPLWDKRYGVLVACYQNHSQAKHNQATWRSS
jgi:hypothetical protein